ncbi:hypothetical protein EIP91_000651 [Steccherinum ochraceum]|uniref:Uncharacterized protein n=1 Tax=Steccherinum ochraceum TaxID=92696 RepID=A0A4R0RFN8_9APHY|nr:hypothetical protein EIP91_000651 [Steccherinum ochraceum]
MSTVPDRKTLEGMKRVDLQKLCKEHGLRANLKSESLIDLIIEATKPSTSQLPRPTRASSMRIISKSSSGSRPRGRSGGSVIIHDTDDEGETTDGPAATAASSQPEPEPGQALPSAPGRAPRKAKESQYKLGVGRPTLAGGSGARSVTRTGSISKPKRGKAPSTSIKPTEEAIQEVDEEFEGQPLPLEPQAGPSGTSHDYPLPAFLPNLPALPNILPTDFSQLAVPGLDVLRTTIEEMILPIRDQMQTLNTNFDEVARNAAEASSLRSQLTLLTDEVALLRIQASRNVQLEAEVTMLKDHLAAMREMSSLGSSHTRTESSETTGKLPAGGSDPSLAAVSGPSAVLLGKRHRSPNDSNLTGIIESGQETELDENDLPGQVVRPSKKRAKLSQDDAGSGSSRASSRPRTPRTPGARQKSATPGPSRAMDTGFTIYSGPEVQEEEYHDPPPPTTHLSDLFATPGPSNIVADSATEGVQTNLRNTAFTFTFPESGFQPITSTPIANLGIGPMPTNTSVPFPEPPTSPTPSPERAGRRIPPFGSPSRSPARIRADGVVASGSSSNQPPGHPEPRPPQFVSPALLMHTPPVSSAPEPPASSRGPNQSSLGIGLGRPRSSGIGMGPVALPLPMPPETPAPPMKRTMYGTELDADSRFGDFGQDGVAMGFWTGVAPRF